MIRGFKKKPVENNWRSKILENAKAGCFKLMAYVNQSYKEQY
jgi:hypothetical protein